MDLFWVEGRVPQPPLKDVIKAAMGLESEGYTHQLNFYYPAKGGFQAISDAVKSKIEPHRLINNFEMKKVKKEDGKWIVNGPSEKVYDRLVSTIHIGDFINSYEGVPKEVKEAANNLRWNSIYLVMLGIKKPNISDMHWAYIPEKEFLPNRISIISNYSPHTVPQGHSSILAEATFAPDGEKAKMKNEEVLERTVNDLVGLGVFRKDDLDYTKVIRLKYAYVVYDTDYQKNIAIVEDWAKKEGVTLLGRFSEFRYYNSDKCIESAMEKSRLFV